MAVEYRAADRKAQSHSILFGREKGFPDTVQDLGWDSDTFVADGDANGPLFIRDFELDLSAMRHCIACVLDQIAQDDEQLMGVCQYLGKIVRDMDGNLDVLWKGYRMERVPNLLLDRHKGNAWFGQASNVGEGGDGMIDEVDLIVDPKEVLPQFLLCCPLGMEKIVDRHFGGMEKASNLVRDATRHLS